MLWSSDVLKGVDFDEIWYDDLADWGDESGVTTLMNNITGNARDPGVISYGIKAIAVEREGPTKMKTSDSYVVIYDILPVVLDPDGQYVLDKDGFPAAFTIFANALHFLIKIKGLTY